MGKKRPRPRRSFTAQSARQAIFEYVESWHNTRRRHSSLGYLSPAAYKASAIINPLPSKVA
ncbi:IS3 family transposase [Micromonospora citrea]|uniref:IS3 family transposase n=1 Tax=Micromonospora citrea TaxID=47855 RepID=UPI000B88A4DA